MSKSEKQEPKEGDLGHDGKDITYQSKDGPEHLTSDPKEDVQKFIDEQKIRLIKMVSQAQLETGCVLYIRHSVGPDNVPHSEIDVKYAG
ncbi:MAG: hypothetical protein AAF702_44570 [Chloroflexota bacterium]